MLTEIIIVIVFIILAVISVILTYNCEGFNNTEHLTDSVALANVAKLYNDGTATLGNLTLTGNLNIKNSAGTIVTTIDNTGNITNKGNITNIGNITNTGTITNTGDITASNQIQGKTLQVASNNNTMNFFISDDDSKNAYLTLNIKNKPKENANLHILNTNISMWNNTDRPVPSLDTIGQINTTNTITANKATIGGLQIYKNSANVPFISRWDTSDGNRSIYFANDTSIVIRGKNVCSGC